MIRLNKIATKENLIAGLLLILLIMQSCSTFQKIPVSLEESMGDGKVKIIDGTGKKRVFDDIIKVDSAYYGRQKSYTGKKEHIARYVLIPHRDTLTIYLSEPKPYRVWIKLRNQQKKLNGILVGVTDSLLLVSSSKLMSDYKKFKEGAITSNGVNVKEIKVHDIEIIKTRRINNIGRGMLIGALAGFGYGLTLDADFGVIAGAALAILAAPTGGIIGSSKLKVPVRGSNTIYNKNKTRLHPLHDYSENKIEPIPITDPLVGYEQGWKAYFSKNEIDEVHRLDSKDRTKNTGAILSSAILIPLVIILGVFGDQ